MSYRAAILNLSARSEAAVVALYARLSARAVTEEEFVAYATAALIRADEQAVSLADLGLAAFLTVATRRAVPTLGLTLPADKPAQLDKAVRTLVAVLPDTPHPEARVARIGRAEPLTTGTRAYGDGMRTRPEVTGYRRSLSGNACELCSWWAGGGRVFPDDRPMPTHKGCSCTQVPVLH